MKKNNSLLFIWTLLALYWNVLCSQNQLHIKERNLGAMQKMDTEAESKD
jgi:hypothetical protein